MFEGSVQDRTTHASRQSWAALKTEPPAQSLWRPPEGADKGAAHAVGIAEANLLGNTPEGRVAGLSAVRAISRRRRFKALAGVVPISAVKARAKWRLSLLSFAEDFAHPLGRTGSVTGTLTGRVDWR
jgi:hypothetical protein